MLKYQENFPVVAPELTVRTQSTDSHLELIVNNILRVEFGDGVTSKMRNERHDPHIDDSELLSLETQPRQTREWPNDG